MSTIRIVTDGSALFLDPTVIQRYQITVVPVYVQIGTDVFRLGVDLDPDALFYRLQNSNHQPILLPPTVEEFYQVYDALNQSTTAIVSMHMSSQLGQIYKSALTASRMLLGRCDIAVVDSQTVSAGLGFLVHRAAEIISQFDQLEPAIKAIRRLLPRVYSVFYLRTMQTLAQRGLIGQAQTILGEMLGVMPFVTIEDGELTIMEKALSDAQAIDKLIEFIGEFTNIEDMLILHSPYDTNENLHLLQDRLAAELGKSNFAMRVYDASIAALLGYDATGIVVLEGEEEEYF